MCYFEYHDDQLKTSLHETSFVNRHINYSVLEVETNLSFSETLQRKAQQIKDAVIVAKRVSGLLQLMAGQLGSMKTIQANKVKKNQIKLVNYLYTYIFNEKERFFFRKCNKNNMFIKQKRAQSSYSLFLKNYVYTVNEKIILTQSME